jgi:hypothetical protein
MKKNILLFICIFFSINIFSQSVGITDFMRLNPYSTFNNPAYFLPYKGYVGIPGVSNINFSCYNSSFLFKNLVTKTQNGDLVMTADKFVNSLAKNNWFNTSLNLNILNFGFRVKKLFFSFDYQLKMDEQLRYSKDLFSFLLQNELIHFFDGTYTYTKSSPALFQLEPNINLYQELSFGCQVQILDNLYIGVRPKILFGVFNLKTEKFKAEVYSNPVDKSICGNFDVSINMASLFQFYTKDANGNIAIDAGNMFSYNQSVSGFLNKCFSNNLGFAIDLGAVFRVNQQIRVSASVTDLGFIKWRGTELKLSIKPPAPGEDYVFTDLTTEQFVNFIINAGNLNFDHAFDAINANFSMELYKPYTTMLTSNIMLDGYFDLTPAHRFIMQFKGYIFGKHFMPQFTLAYNGTFLNIFDVVVSYSMMKKSFANIGVGFGVRLGPVHLYAGTDNLLAYFNILNARRINGTAGLLLDFPVKAKVKEAELKSLFANTEER